MSKPLTKQERAKDSYLRRHFHTTLEEYKKVFKFQKGKCGICKRSASIFSKALAVDHCHLTGLIRGLLCMDCNRALGKFRDSTERLLAAAAYVQNPPASEALGDPRFTLPGRIGTKVRAKKLAAMKIQGTKSN